MDVCKISVEIVTRKVMEVEGQVLGKWLGHGGGDLINEISIVIKRKIPEGWLVPFYQVKTPHEGVIYEKIDCH